MPGSKENENCCKAVFTSRIFPPIRCSIRLCEVTKSSTALGFSFVEKSRPDLIDIYPPNLIGSHPIKGGNAYGF